MSTDAATETTQGDAIQRLTQLLLGHADIRSTSRYAHLDTEDLAEALERLYGSDED